MVNGQTIDLMDGCQSFEQSALLAEQMAELNRQKTELEEEFGYGYLYQPLHRRVPEADGQDSNGTTSCLYEDIANRNVPNTFIANMGGGRNRLFDASIQSSVISIDIDRSERETPEHDVLLDLRTLPRYAAGGLLSTKLPVLQKFYEMRQIPKIANAIKSLSTLLTSGGKEGIGSYLFSHCLLYLSPEDAEKVLRLAVHNLHPGGSITIAESGLAFVGDPSKSISGIRGFDEAKAACKSADDITVAEDFYLVGQLRPEDVDEYELLAKQDNYSTKCRDHVGRLVHSNDIPVVRLPTADFDECTADMITRDDGKILASGVAERVMRLERRVS